MSTECQTQPSREDYGSVTHLCTKLGYPGVASKASGTLSCMAVNYRKTFMGEDELARFPTSHLDPVAQQCASEFIVKHARMFKERPLKYPEDMDKLRDWVAKLMCAQQSKHLSNKAQNGKKKREKENDIFDLDPRPKKRPRTDPRKDRGGPRIVSSSRPIDLTEDFDSPDTIQCLGTPTNPDELEYLLHDRTLQHDDNDHIQVSHSSLTHERDGLLPQPPNGIQQTNLVVEPVHYSQLGGSGIRQIDPVVETEQFRQSPMPEHSNSDEYQVNDTTEPGEPNGHAPQAQKEVQQTASHRQLSGAGGTGNTIFSEDATANQGSSGNSDPKTTTNPPQNPKPTKPKLKFILEDEMQGPDEDSPVPAATVRSLSISDFFDMFCTRSARPLGSVSSLNFNCRWGNRACIQVDVGDNEEAWHRKLDRIRDLYTMTKGSLRMRDRYEVWVVGPAPEEEEE